MVESGEAYLVDFGFMKEGTVKHPIYIVFCSLVWSPPLVAVKTVAVTRVRV